ncbi:hypothetical protein [Desulfovibrio cuneatus]|uniref:hypothetical protein n=1 Tax=Desulfovibrio cuneatus TaxID=159728 RepID=UPI00040D951B|nr:hypothetical protein [Desulfovibrio cuneatus]
MNTSEQEHEVDAGVCEDALAVSAESDRPCPDSIDPEEAGDEAHVTFKAPNKKPAPQEPQK